MHKYRSRYLFKSSSLLHLTVQNLRTIMMAQGSEPKNSEKGECTMTKMKRVTFSVPEVMAEKILLLRKDDEFIQCSYSEIVRRLLDIGLDVQAQKNNQAS